MPGETRVEGRGSKVEEKAADGAILIDGVAIAKAVRADVARETAELKTRGVTPGLTVVIVGEDPASQSYVKSKEKASIEAGMKGETKKAFGASCRTSPPTRWAGITYVCRSPCVLCTS